ncbi:phosphopantetheine-binding protein [Streptomyces lydicus]|nr:phosphopantetheine-binding protein [Streptomyces lydicus]
MLSAVRDLLARSEVSLTESFTGAGGTSLLAARLLTVIEKESGVRLRARAAAPAGPARRRAARRHPPRRPATGWSLR